MGFVQDLHVGVVFVQDLHGDGCGTGSRWWNAGDPTLLSRVVHGLPVCVCYRMHCGCPVTGGTA